MGSYVFAFLALILLIPSLFLFPVLFTKKGKWVIPIVAFVISMAGIYVYQLLTLWHSIILMLLLLLLTAILLQRQPLIMTSAEKTNTHSIQKEKLGKQSYSLKFNINKQEQKTNGVHKKKRLLEGLSDHFTKNR